MRNKQLSSTQIERRWKICILVIVVVVALAFVLLFVFSTNRSSITIIDDWNIEIELGETTITFPIIFTDDGEGRETHIHVQQRADSELNFHFAFNGVADISFYSQEGVFRGERTVFFDESFVISPTGSNEAHFLVITPRVNLAHDDRHSNISNYSYEYNLITVQPIRIRRLHLEEENAVRINFYSPSCLQLALFTHMAYFPFDFNAGEKPQYHDFKPFHHEPFYSHVMQHNAWGFNYFGFNFYHEMKGWYLLDIFDDERTGFRLVIYHNEDYSKIVVSIRGSYGGIIESLSSQDGTWWYNFTSLSGNRHYHVDSLVNFLNEPSFNELLRHADIYITRIKS